MKDSAHPSFKLKDPSLLVSGGWINGRTHLSSSGKTYKVLDPGAGTPWFTQQDLDSKDLDAAVAAADTAFKSWRHVPPRQRGRVIMKADALFTEALGDVAQIMVMESGKTLAEAKGEAGLCCELVAFRSPSRRSWILSALLHRHGRRS